MSESAARYRPARLALIALPVLLAIWLLTHSTAATNRAVNVKVQLEGAKDFAELIENADGTHSYVLHEFDGSRTTISPEQFAARLYEQQSSRNWLYRIFNISSPLGVLWVSIGLLGQFMFTGRMVVQWFVSEKNKKSIVPAAFWWLSILGGSMLLAYFLWRRDLVGILGQSLGIVVYVRNIVLIRRDRLEAGLQPV